MGKKKYTDEQLIEWLTNGGTCTGFAKEHKLNSRGVRLRRAKLADKGRLDEIGIKMNVPEGRKMGKVTGQYNAKGELIQFWPRFSEDEENLEQSLSAMRKAFKDDLPKSEKKPPLEKLLNADIMNLYVISDYHLGMMAWGEETGADWDMKIAEKTFYDWFQSAINISPDSETAVLCNLSDFLHWDGMEAVTPTNKHVLDADSRFQKLVRVCLRMFRKVVDMLLDKHKYVHIIHAGGNHDPASTVWLREMFDWHYSDDERVSVDSKPDLYCCYEFGKTSLFFHHGHKRRMGNIDTVFASKFRDVFGRTKHSYGHMGHLHHIDVKETNLMVIEQHRTLAAPDAHASTGGWLSGRDAKVITYHSEFGEVARNAISVDMIEAGLYL